MANYLIEKYGAMESVEVITTGPGSYVNGRWVEGPPTLLPIVAAVMPLALSEMATTVEATGLETRDAIALYTEYPLKEADRKTKQDRDVVRWKDNDYVIRVVVHRYQIPSLNHYKAIAVLKGS